MFSHVSGSLVFVVVTFINDEQDSSYESYGKEDDGKEWEDTLAFKLINDENVKIGKHCGMVVNWETGEEKIAVDYYLIYYDMNHYMNKPSKLVSISDRRC